MFDRGRHLQIRDRAGGCEAQYDLALALDDRVIGLPRDLDDDARMRGAGGTERVQRANRRGLAAEQRQRRHLQRRAIEIDPQLVAVRAQLQSRRGSIEAEAEFGDEALAMEVGRGYRSVRARDYEERHREQER